MTVPGENKSKALFRLKEEVEEFLRSLAHPIVVENDTELFDLTAADWRLEVEFGKLMLEVWNPARSIARRLEELAYRDGRRLGVFVRKPGARETSTLEFRSLDRDEFSQRGLDRARFQKEFRAALTREFPGWRLDRVSNRSDRAHSFSARYTRGLGLRGTRGWAFLGLPPGESPAAADDILAYGLIWLDWLRGQSDRFTVSGLKLFLPPDAVEVTAHRAVYLKSQAVQVEVYEWDGGPFRPVDLKDFGNVETSLAPRRQGEALLERHRESIGEWLGEIADRVDVVSDATGSLLSLRVCGLEVARVEGQLAPRVYWGLQEHPRRIDEDSLADFREFVRNVLETRTPSSRDGSHPYFRLQSERWLESLLVRDVTKLDPALSATPVYPQVPAWTGGDRGVIDILAVTKRGRLAVIELKLEEEINLPMQALDYWLRVKWLHERLQFEENGYFPGIELSPAPPLLYLVCPAFRYHSTTGRLTRYLDSSIDLIQVGLNQQWREGVKILFRRELRAGG